MMGSNYVDPKTVLDNVKSTTWKFFKFRMEGGEVDKNYVFCRLCLDGGNEGKRGQIKYCGGTTIYYIAYKWIHISPFRIYYLWKITIWVYIWLFGKNQWLIGYQISLIVIARQPKYHRFYALVILHLDDKYQCFLHLFQLFGRYISADLVEKAPKYFWGRNIEMSYRLYQIFWLIFCVLYYTDK